MRSHVFRFGKLVPFDILVAPRHQANGGSNQLGSGQGVSDEALERSPVVVVVNATHGPGSLTMDNSISNEQANSGNQSTPFSLFITAKHIQASRALLEMAKAHGKLLDSSWHIVLTTFQVLFFQCL